jgi:hypothetical protein
VPRAASPSEAPIWRVLLSRPEAAPVSCVATPAVAREDEAEHGESEQQDPLVAVPVGEGAAQQEQSPKASA